MEINDDSCNVVAKMESETDKLHFGFFPESLLLEFIRRLPVKSIFRSKCVSKQLLSLISDPYFAQFYASALSPLLQDSLWARIYVPRITCRLNIMPSAFLCDMMNTDNLQPCYPPPYFKRLDDDAFSGDRESIDVYSLSLPITHQPEIKKEDVFGIFCRFEIVQVHLDIVLYASDDHCHEYYICNPFTGQWIALPPTSRPFHRVSSGFVTQVGDGILMSYTVVRFNCFRVNNILNFEVFTSGTGEWNSYDINVDRMLQLSPLRKPVSFNGILHWVLQNPDEILAYDPHKHPREYRIIPLPKDKNEVNDPKRIDIKLKYCVIHRGCLMYLEVSGMFALNDKSQHFISVWKLNDYDTGEWSLEDKVYCGDISSTGLSSVRQIVAVPLAFDPFCGDVLYLGCRNCVLSYNFQTRKLKSHGTPNRPNLVAWPQWQLVSLLVPMPTPTLIHLPPSVNGHSPLLHPAEEA